MHKNSQTAYNAGRDMFDAGRAKACPYVEQSPLSAFWWRGWFDAERKLLAKTSG